MANSMIYERDVLVATRAGEPLRANVYRPVAEGKYPVIMTLGPYGKDRNWADRNQKQARDLGAGPFINWETPDPETWVPKGYVVVRVDGRGTGASPGVLAPFSNRAAEDYFDAIEWAAVQPWCTGKVGLAGISFYAMTQWPAAALRPPHLTCMIPWEAAADLYRDFMRAGGMVNSKFLTWWWPNTVLNVQHGANDSLTEQQRAANTVVSLINDALSRPLATQAGDEWRTNLANIDVPFLSVGNWGNIGLHLRGNVEAFLAAGSKQKWLRVVTGDHIHPFYEPENIALEERFLAHFLKGEKNGWESEPRVTLAIRDGANVTWRTDNAWPLSDTQWTQYHLNASGFTLSTEAPAATGRCEFSAMGAPVTFKTEPAASPLEITGPVALRLWASSSTKDMDIFVRVGRTEPDGREIWGVGPELNDVALTQGWLRASHRKLDKDKSLSYRPYHTHDVIEPLVPGEPVALDIEIWPTSITIPPGSRLILEIGGHELINSHFFHEDPRDRPLELFAGTTTLLTGPKTPSSLLLPVIPRK